MIRFSVTDRNSVCIAVILAGFLFWYCSGTACMCEAAEPLHYIVRLMAENQ